MAPIRVLLADDHEEVLDDIRDLLQPEFVVVAAVGDGPSLLLAAEKLKPDVIVTDISMPQMDGIAAAKVILQKDPTSRVILLTVHNDPALVNQGFAAGVRGYVLKLKASQELAQAIRRVLQGERYLSPSAKV
jgi:DNA-binding NarL/FixJ family response regulator